MTYLIKSHQIEVIYSKIHALPFYANILLLCKELKSKSTASNKQTIYTKQVWKIRPVSLALTDSFLTSNFNREQCQNCYKIYLAHLG